ncbi:enediyne biosynthesis protein [Actinoplanes ianthinogenes]|uniref:Enediyne biosynthesis protein n=1 Tax=Actinoplanes ianthinogenes TaxID=122358 RepID=A0ABM7LPF5_9ACTN|nr:DUF1702 family protein [Actinoplanes ianthinogenes]BCJ41159.1 enediyne biosynthesis protein [Actinoplanes ianthinogenes]GGR22499.1 enediyne biosynthesis protein [Actinoplanes ianthinogenes]
MGIVAGIRRRILTPNVSQTSMAVRGFHVKSDTARDRLETVGRTFLEGYALAAEARRPGDAVPGLEEIPTEFKGFAYEGAGMAFAVRDGLPFGGKHTQRFLEGPGEPHIYMAYVGVGWAMARLPRARWSTLYAPDPLLRWLVLDGYGFYQAYFKTDKYVAGQYRSDRSPWPDDDYRRYAAHAIDQGVGRAMWFVAGTDARRLHAMVQAFPEHRRADLYAGTGLAATYAGGADEAELLWLREAVGEYAGDLAQGASFAAGARVRAGLVVPHNEVATRVFCGRTPAEASRINDDALIDLDHQGTVPAYEQWRQRIKQSYRPAAVTSGESA